MKINLKNIPIMYLNLTENIERRVRLERDFKKWELNQNLQRFSAYKGGEVFDKKSRHLAVKRGGNKSMKEMASAMGKERLPFLLLEDDVQVLNYVEEFTIPDDADAVYLGINTTAITKWDPSPVIKSDSTSLADFMTEGIFTHKKIDENISKLGAMYGAQAILYVSQRYYDHAMWTYEMAIEHDIEYDKIRCLTMPFYNIYALNRPVFYADSQPDIINYGIE